jgi:hypothetical protein
MESLKDLLLRDIGTYQGDFKCKKTGCDEPDTRRSWPVGPQTGNGRAE